MVVSIFNKTLDFHPPTDTANVQNVENYKCRFLFALHLTLKKENKMGFEHFFLVQQKLCKKGESLADFFLWGNNFCILKVEKILYFNICRFSVCCWVQKKQRESNSKKFSGIMMMEKLKKWKKNCKKLH